MFKRVAATLRQAVVLIILFFIFIAGFKFFNEYLMLKNIVKNLTAESRMAEALVVESSLDEFTRKYTTTIKFLEYDVRGLPLKP